MAKIQFSVGEYIRRPIAGNTIIKHLCGKLWLVVNVVVKVMYIIVYSRLIHRDYKEKNETMGQVYL